MYMDKSFYKNLDRNIIKRRKQLGLTQEQLANELVISLNFMRKI